MIPQIPHIEIQLHPSYNCAALALSAKQSCRDCSRQCSFINASHLRNRLFPRKLSRDRLAGGTKLHSKFGPVEDLCEPPSHGLLVVHHDQTCSLSNVSSDSAAVGHNNRSTAGDRLCCRVAEVFILRRENEDISVTISPPFGVIIKRACEFNPIAYAQR